jgi:hypothetical protein
MYSTLAATAASITALCCGVRRPISLAEIKSNLSTLCKAGINVSG